MAAPLPTRGAPAKNLMCGLPVTKGDMWKVGSFSVSSTSTTDDCRQHNHHQRELTVICCHQRLLRSHTEKQGKGWMTPCMHDAIDWEQREQHIAGIDESSELLLLLQASHVIHGRGGEVCVCVVCVGGGGGGGGGRIQRMAPLLYLQARWGQGHSCSCSQHTGKECNVS